MEDCLDWYPRTSSPSMDEQEAQWLFNTHEGVAYATEQPDSEAAIRDDIMSPSYQDPAQVGNALFFCVLLVQSVGFCILTIAVLYTFLSRCEARVTSLFP